VYNESATLPTPSMIDPIPIKSITSALSKYD
jgi:hypothetical protein